MSKLINVGVVGCGYWGPNLVRNFRSLPGCNLKMMCDVSAARLHSLKALYPGVMAERSFGHMLNGVGLDAVTVATSVKLHFPMAKAALLAGKHVLIEKPMAASAAQCEELIEIARQKGLVLMVGHTFLYSPAVRKIKEIIDHLVGQLPESVNCSGSAHITPQIEDVTLMTLIFGKDRSAIIHSSWLDPRKVREMTVVGSKRMLVYDDVAPLEKIRIFDACVKRPPHYDTFAEFQYAYHYGDISSPYLNQEEPLKAECLHFLECIRESKSPLSCGARGLEVVRILEASSASLKLGGGAVPLGRSQPTPSANNRPTRPSSRGSCRTKTAHALCA